VPLGLLMGSFEAVRSFFNPPINAIRYMPASAFIPLLILLQGLGEDERSRSSGSACSSSWC